MWDGHDGMGWWMLWASFFWLVIILAAALLFARVASGQGTSSRERERPAAREEMPLDIARRRYAAGEISRDEFEQLKRDLQ
jgi:putative membrane protein